MRAAPVSGAVAPAVFDALAPAVFDEGLAEGRGQLQTRDGEVWDLPVPTWLAEAGAADEGLLARCQGATLDVGCGPGRMTAALSRRGVPALGVDVSPLAVAMTRSRGAAALRGDIFSVTPGGRQWSHVLLADGNVGIGGDPVRLLWRCRELVEPDGSVLVDLSPPGRSLRVVTARLVGSSGPGEWFPWAQVSIAALTAIAPAVGLSVVEVWAATDDDRRWQAELVRTRTWVGPEA